jgi:hypothetical protein
VIEGEFDASEAETEAWFEREGKGLIESLGKEMDDEPAMQARIKEMTQEFYYSPHDDDEYFDEVVIRTVPRYKTSGLSGDEWRVSAVVELKRKGMVVYDRGFGTLAAATAFLPGIFISARENLPADVMEAQRARPVCMQPGCAEPATTVYRKRRRYDRDGRAYEPMTGGEYLRFCQRHARRGDCGLEDADENYEVISGPGPAGASGFEGDISEAARVEVRVDSLDEMPGAVKQAIDDFRKGSADAPASKVAGIKKD